MALRQFFRGSVAGADEAAQRAVRVAADGDDPRDRSDGAHGRWSGGCRERGAGSELGVEVPEIA